MFGTTLGQYQIASQFAVEVSRAKDRTLGWDVATKVVHKGFARAAHL